MDVDGERERAINSLRAIKESLEGNMSNVKMPVVRAYQSALDKLEKTGMDVSDFRIPAPWIQTNVPTIYYPQFGGPGVSRERFVIKLDSLLEYLE